MNFVMWYYTTVGSALVATLLSLTESPLLQASDLESSVDGVILA